MNTATVKSRRWIVWLLLPTLALSVWAWFDEPASDADASAGRHSARSAPRLADRPQDPARIPMTTAKVPSSEQLVERLELPPTAKAEKRDPADPETAASVPIDLLAARSWYVPPPAPPPVVPKAPPLPFKVLGRIIEDEDPVVFLSNQDRNLVVRAGTKLDNNYLVESIDKTQMTFIYLPLAERQTLMLGAVN